MTFADRVTRLLGRIRAGHRTAAQARLLLAGAGLVALLVETTRPWDLIDAFGYLGVALLAAAVVSPDSAAPLAFLGCVAGGWLVRAPGDVGWDVVVVAIALLVVHLAAAYAAQVPAYAVPAPGVLRRWLLPATVAAALAVVAAVAAAALRGAGVPGSLVVTVAALILLTAVTWLAAPVDD